MARLVAAMGMTHTPLIYWAKVPPPEQEKAAALKSFEKLKKRMDEASPDAIVVIANDHIDNFFYDNMPSFCVGVSARAEGPFSMEHEMGIPEYSCPVAEDAGRTLLRVGFDEGLDLAWSQQFGVDHAFVVPLGFVAPSMNTPIVPVFTNTLVPPIPQPHRFYELGKAIGKAIERRPAGERLAVLASFNLSIEVGGPRMRQRDPVFDDEALQLMEAGNVEEILRRFTLRRLAEVGNATGEFLNYVATLGLVGSRRPAFTELRVVPRWGSCPVVAWDL